MKRTFPLALAILVLAFGLRFFRLDAQSFWNDEGNSARIAERETALILEGAAGDIHPPGYYLLLHWWRGAVGQTEFALRSLSALAGVAFVALTYALGRNLYGALTGSAAAFLCAFSPFAITYSQEARMYALLGVCSVASTLLLTEVLRSAAAERTTRVKLAGYVLSCAAGLYTQYAFAFMVLVHNAVAAAWWLGTGRSAGLKWRLVPRWFVVQVAVAALYVPWLPTALGSVTGWSSAGGDYELIPALVDVLRILTVGPTLPAARAAVALAGAVILLSVGLVGGRDSGRYGTGQWRRPGFAEIVAGVYLGLPVTLIFAFDLYKSAWLKFLIVVLAPFLVLVARGARTVGGLLVRLAPATAFAGRARLGLVLRLLALAPVVLPLAPSLRNLYFDPAYARDDYRQIAADIAADARPGDAILLHAPNQWEVFTYYYPDQDVYPTPYRGDTGRVRDFLTPLAERYERLFVLYWGDAESDPQRLVESWLADHVYKSSDRWYGRVRLTTYAVASPSDAVEPVLIDARFGETALLRGFTLPVKHVAAGDILPVALHWQAAAPIPERYKVTLQLLDSSGALLSQHDAEPGQDLAPTNIWTVGELIVDRHGIAVPVTAQPGISELVVGLYHLETGDRLPVVLDGSKAGDLLTLSGVEVGP
jgi:mannosyltransferase